MRVQISQMELDILKLLKNDKNLRKAGWRVEWQKPYCLLETTPDFTLTKGERRIGLYLDGEKAHRNRQLRDEKLRDMLQKRKGVTPLSISYPYHSDVWVERVFKQIKEALKEN